MTLSDIELTLQRVSALLHGRGDDTNTITNTILILYYYCTITVLLL